MNPVELQIVTAFAVIGATTTAVVFSWALASVWVKVFPR